MKEFWKQVFSENGEPSSKRVFAAEMFDVCLAMFIVFCIREGCTDCVKDLFQTLVICGTTLLGVSTVSGIFKK